MRDTISITALSLRSPDLEPDLWNRSAKSQPLLVSLSIETDVSSEATTDSLLGESLNYGTVTKAIEAALDSLRVEAFGKTAEQGIALEELAELLAKVVIFHANAPNVQLELSRPRALLSAESVSVRIYRQREDYERGATAALSQYRLARKSSNWKQDRLAVNGLRRSIIIGVNPCERVDEQEVIVDLEFGSEDMQAYNGSVRQGWRNWRGVVKSLESHLSASHPLTIEALTTDLARIILTPPQSPSTSVSWDVPSTSVKISKPCALQFAKYPSVKIQRERGDFFNRDGSLVVSRRISSVAASSSVSTNETQSSRDGDASSVATEVEGGGRLNNVILGIGTNMGERMGNIARALFELERDGSDGSGAKTRVVDTSFLYESEAMYVVDQAKFLNAVVQIETPLAPLELLSLLKSIEDSLGRKKTVRNGPRVIDLDILFYNELVLDSRNEAGARPDDERWLKIPHASIAEREFVLRPLSDLSNPPRHPLLHSSPQDLLAALLSTTPSTIHRVLPLTSSLTHALSSRTLVMSILNTTPDSFSDGGDNAELAAALESALQHIKSGVDIIDVGGMSTRPGAVDVEEEEEISRVVPIIKAIRKHNSTIAISVDTFRPRVARAAVAAGATIINDVLGGSTDGMLETMASLDLPVILMHSRGTPKTMSKLTAYPTGVVEGVREELDERVRKALATGVKRWNIVVDPGVGFAKTGEDNVALLKNLSSLLFSSPTTSPTSPALPSLVGLSRKKFLGTLTGKDNPKERVWATAVGVTASIAAGTDIVRVHDVEEMMDVVRVSDAIYRNKV